MQTLQLRPNKRGADFWKFAATGARVVRFIPGFVLQIELPEAAADFARRVSDKPTGEAPASYTRGEIVLCLAQDDAVPARPQIAVFLEDIAESHPAYPVVGTISDMRLLGRTAGVIGALQTANHMLTTPEGIELAVSA